jgi:protein-S-isoprenylcysteine O-methyltransferase Ste14
MQVLLTATWGLFLLVWLVTALRDRRSAPPVERRSRWWNTGVLTAVCYLLAVRLVPETIWARLTVHTTWLTALGAAVLVASLGFTVWARLQLGTMWTSAPTIKAGHELRSDGPYAWVRHPLYTGVLGMMVGSVLVAGFGPTSVALLCVVVAFVRKIQVEERMLTETFPDAYPAYRAAVPALVPWPKPRHRAPR